MFRKIFCLFIAVLAISQLAACVVPNARLSEITPEMIEQQAILFGSMSRVEGLQHYSNYNVDVRSTADSKVTSLRVFDGHLGGREIDVIEDGIVRSTFAREVPPGEYKVAQVRVHTTNGYTSREWTFTPKNPATVTVEAGKAYYLGAHVVLPTIRDNWVGLEGIWEPHYLPMMNADADIAMAKQRYPNLPPVEVPESISGNPYDSMVILALAKAINPEAEYWDEEAWQMVKDLEPPVKSE